MSIGVPSVIPFGNHGKKGKKILFEKKKHMEKHLETKKTSVLPYGKKDLLP